MTRSCTISASWYLVAAISAVWPSLLRWLSGHCRASSASTQAGSPSAAMMSAVEPSPLSESTGTPESSSCTIVSRSPSPTASKSASACGWRSITGASTIAAAASCAASPAGSAEPSPAPPSQRYSMTKATTFVGCSRSAFSRMNSSVGRAFTALR